MNNIGGNIYSIFSWDISEKIIIAQKEHTKKCAIFNKTSASQAAMIISIFFA
ncbi:MAG: hypothetical protein KAS94_09475 [Desulfobulbaceae bacterium]|nr:hypothetical protein [Desulfobulbaceae bacterium]